MFINILDSFFFVCYSCLSSTHTAPQISSCCTVFFFLLLLFKTEYVCISLQIHASSNQCIPITANYTDLESCITVKLIYFSFIECQRKCNRMSLWNACVWLGCVRFYCRIKPIIWMQCSMVIGQCSCDVFLWKSKLREKYVRLELDASINE